MSTRRLEEILEECLSAYLDGRRSISESLSRYPSDAAELEPLLRAATSLNTTLNAVSPPAHVQQRGLHRFLSDARARQNLKALKVSGTQPGRLSVFWQKYRLGFAGAGMAVVILASSIGGTALLGGNGGGDFAGNPSTSATPAVVTNLRQQVDTVRSRRDSQSLTKADIERLLSAAQDLQNAPDSEIDPSIATISQALTDADALVSEIIANDPILAQPAGDAQEKIREVAAAIGAEIGSPTTVVTADPGTATAEPTAAPTAEPTAEPTPTVAPTEAPTPTLPPTTEPPPRAPAGFTP